MISSSQSLLSLSCYNMRSPGLPGGGTPRLAQPGNNHESHPYDRMVRVNLNTLSVAVFGRVQITITYILYRDQGCSDREYPWV